MGCIARLGCLILLAILAVGGWFTRNLWLPERFRTQPPTVAASGWQPATQAGAERSRQALARLSEPQGPVFQTLSAGDVAAFGFAELAKRVSHAVDSVAAKIDADRISMRGVVNTAAFKGQLGPVASMLGDRESVELTGTFNVVRPGLGAFAVQNARVGRLSVPSGMIPRLIRAVDESRRPDGLPDNAMALPMPTYVGDIRIANGKVTLYKNVR